VYAQWVGNFVLVPQTLLRFNFWTRTCSCDFEEAYIEEYSLFPGESPQLYQQNIEAFDLCLRFEGKFLMYYVNIQWGMIALVAIILAVINLMNTWCFKTVKRTISNFSSPSTERRKKSEDERDSLMEHQMNKLTDSEREEDVDASFTAATQSGMLGLIS